MNLADLTTQDIVNIIAALTQELAERTGVYAPPPPPDPVGDLLSSLAKRGAQAQPARPAVPRGAPPGTPLMPPKVQVTGRTDPEAAAFFAKRPDRQDGVPAINGNGEGLGGAVEVVG